MPCRKQSSLFLGKLIGLTFMVLSLTGCGLLDNKVTGTSSSLVDFLYPDGEQVNHSLDVLPHLKLPLDVGIAFVPSSKYGIDGVLSEMEKIQLLDKVAEKFEGRSSIKSIQVIPEQYLKQGKGFRTLEQVARMFSVDVMALVSYDQIIASRGNNLSLAYWTIVGAYIIPGNSSDTQTFVDTAVFDIASRKLLFRAPGVDRMDRIHTFVSRDKVSMTLRKESFGNAVEKMSSNLEQSLSQFKEEVKNGKKATIGYKKGYSGGSLPIEAALLGMIFALWRRRIVFKP